jgi:hypothetical protein
MKTMIQAGKVMSAAKMVKAFGDFDLQNDDKVSVKSVFGLWKDRNIDKNSLRREAWARF